MPAITLVWLALVPRGSVTPMAGRDVLGFGEHPGTAGGLPLPSVPFAKYTFELAPAKAMLFPDKVKAEGNWRLSVCAATTYCTSLWLPFGPTSRPLSSNAPFAETGGVAVTTRLG